MTRQLAVSLSAPVQDAIERWRLSLTVPVSKSAAIAALVAEGLKAHGVEVDEKAGQAR